MADTIFEAATGLPLLPADEANERIIDLTKLLLEFADGPNPVYITPRGGMNCLYCGYYRNKGYSHSPDCLWLRAKELLNA